MKAGHEVSEDEPRHTLNRSRGIPPAPTDGVEACSNQEQYYVVLAMNLADWVLPSIIHKHVLNT